MPDAKDFSSIYGRNRDVASKVDHAGKVGEVTETVVTDDEEHIRDPKEFEAATWGQVGRRGKQAEEGREDAPPAVQDDNVRDMHPHFKEEPRGGELGEEGEEGKSVPRERSAVAGWREGTGRTQMSFHIKNEIKKSFDRMIEDVNRAYDLSDRQKLNKTALFNGFVLSLQDPAWRQYFLQHIGAVPGGSGEKER